MEIKILHIISGLGDGGAEANLYNFICNTKNQINYVISLKDKGKYGSLLEKKGIEIYYINFSNRISFIKKFIFLFKLIKKLKPDIVQTWLYHADLIGGCAAYLANSRNIFWGIHHTSLESRFNKKSIIFISKLNSFLSHIIPRRIVVCAEKSMDEHIKKGFNKDKFIVIRNGVDLNKFKYSESIRRKYREKIKINQSELLLGTVARYNPIKDFPTLIKAIKKLKSSGLNFKYLFVGENMDLENKTLVNIIEKYNLMDKIKLIGQEENISNVMNALDLHILSSKSEAFPMVILESLACGTPSISTNVGDVRKIIKHKKFLVDKENYLALYKAINKFLNLEEENKKKISKECINHIKVNYSIQKMTKEYLRLYETYI
tara:strand:- start:2127 stop:3251 length:1125 start_codon:yes stop_codon:yes gene_type:complete